MNKLFFFFILTILLQCSKANAQEFNTLVPKKIVILLSTKDYATAKKFALQASKKLGKEIKIADLKPNKKIGLTHNKDFCESFGYPCYIPRGEGDAQNSDHISIEYSNGYEGFAKGYYIVVAGIGDPKSHYLTKVLSNAKKHYKGAYAKKTSVWFGCMH